jgi:hypothetical protein
VAQRLHRGSTKKLLIMRIGIISEGHSDRAVITNILIGILGLDSSAIEPLRPIYKKDNTDKANIDPQTFSSWSIVKEECETRELIDSFLAIEGQDFIVIHLDTAQADEYGINRPDKKSDNYCSILRSEVIKQISEWLKVDLSSNLLHAVAIEEVDAWVLTIYEAKQSCSCVDPKGKLKYVLNKRNCDSTTNFDNYLVLSKNFAKEREIKKGRYLDYNCSLFDFFEEINTKVKTRLQQG